MILKPNNNAAPSHKNKIIQGIKTFINYCKETFWIWNDSTINKNKQRIEEDVFLKKYLQEIKLDSPKFNFIENILDLIIKEEKYLIKNTPIISKKGDLLLLALLLLVCPFYLKKRIRHLSNFLR